MAAKSVNIFFFIALSVSTCASKDAEVSCVVEDSCVLPCSFQSGPGPIIHWFKEPDGAPVYSFYHGQNQLSHQNKDYTDRTSLFEEEVSRGNASLLLSQVKVQDEGRYRCYTSTSTSFSRESFINLNVFAPVAEVELQQEEEELRCRSTDVYPQPEVSWTPSTEHHTTVETTESGLYSVVSSVRLPHSPPHEHSCNVSTLHSWRNATYRRNAQMLENETTIPCMVSDAEVKSLQWIYNHSETIFNRTGSELVYSESWRQFVDRVSEFNNSLVLKNLTSDHQGLYSCVLRTDYETYVINTELKLKLGAGRSDLTSHQHLVNLIVIFSGSAILIVVICWCCTKKSQLISRLSRYRKRRKQKNRNSAGNIEVENLADVTEDSPNPEQKPPRSKIKHTHIGETEDGLEASCDHLEVEQAESEQTSAVETQQPV